MALIPSGVVGCFRAKHQTMTTFQHFASLEDPRSDHTKHYPLASLIFLTISAVVSNCKHFTEIAAFAEERLKWFQGHGHFPEGLTPSHDVLNDLFKRIDPRGFRSCFVEWTAAVSRVSKDRLIAIDGKTLRRNFDKFLGKKAIHVISAWSSANQLVLAQLKVDDKSNEITAIPELLALLNLKGAVVSMDAMGCPKDIAEKIIDQGGDYLLGLKGNQYGTGQQVEMLFVHQAASSSHEGIDKGHGRIEVRQCDVIDDPALLARIEGWPKLRSIVRIRSLRQELSSGKEPSEEIRFYISSAGGSAEQFNTWVRQHWGVENKLHWVLDVNFREDEDRIRRGHADQNMAVVRHTALNICRLYNDPKKSLSRKRLAAAWSENYLNRLLGFKTR